MINRHLTVQLVTTAVRFITHAGTFIATAFHLGQLRHFTISAADRGAQFPFFHAVSSFCGQSQMPMSKTLGLSPCTLNADFSRQVAVHAAHRDGRPTALIRRGTPSDAGRSPDFIYLSAALLPTSQPT
jgi:hypothetical protein